MSPSLPLIAIIAATTTKKIVNPSTANLALFNYLLPSLARTLDCGFRYEYVLGFDIGDPFYDTDEGMQKVKHWFTENIRNPLERNAISLSLRIVKVNNTLSKPGPVFLEMARVAYAANAQYFYRVNDDSEFVSNWAHIFVHTLEHVVGFPFGVVGPHCKQGNRAILTHDFTHRTHMEIFAGDYYPPQFTDWYMDDWISRVYGQSRTYRAMHAEVVHHTGAHGQRYIVDKSHHGLLNDLVTQGRKQIRNYMIEHRVDNKTLTTFDSDRFISFSPRYAPAVIIPRV